MADLKALVVDDASFVRDLVKRTMRTSFPSFKVEEAINGKKAQLMMNKVAFDLILCDWEMPEMSGLELLRWARQHDAYKKTPFIMITSRGDRDHVVEAIKEGVTGYLGKPFSPEQLGERIRKAMGKKLTGAESQSNSSPLQDAFKQSASLLMGGSAKTVETSPAGKPVVQAKPAKREPAAVKPSGNNNVAEVRFAESTLKCVIKGVSLTEVKLVARRESGFPGILESAVVDIEFEEGKMARLNGYVHQLQAVDRHQDTEFVSLIIRFVDEDPEKMEHLSKFMSRF